MTQSSAIPKSQWSNYRPIAPLIAPQKILPRPEQVPEKRKWESLDSSDLPSKNHERRGSGSSQGSNSSANLAIDQRLRRKEQNRAAQRAFRERKERYVKELEDKIKAIEEAHAIRVNQLEQENEQLKTAMKEIQAEMSQLKGSPTSSNDNNYSNSNNNSNNNNNSNVLDQMPTLDSTQSIDTDSHTETSPASNSAFTAQSLSPLLPQQQQIQRDSVETNSRTISASNNPSNRTVNTPSSAVECIRDKDGVSFCERLKEEVCYNAYEQLVSEPLFDSQGILNDSVSSHPVPIVTSPLSNESSSTSVTAIGGARESNNDSNNNSELPNAEMFDRLQKTLTNKAFDASDKVTNGNLISCSQVWRELAAHPLFKSFDHELLCDELKKRAKCSNSGPVFYEEDVKEVLDTMEKVEKV